MNGEAFNERIFKARVVTLSDIANLQRGERQALFDRLIDMASQTSSENATSPWDYYCAAHVVGQNQLALHLKSHTCMLRLSVHQRDWPEAAGQVFRMALLPLGHALNRLPVGNTGRADVSAFAPMALPGKLAQVIAEAQSLVTFHQKNHLQDDPTSTH